MKLTLLCIVTLVSFVVHLHLTSAQMGYIGIFAQEPDGYVGYIDGPFPSWINPDYDGPSPSRPNLTVGKPMGRDECKNCWNCHCDDRDCRDWCPRCKDDFWFDCRRDNKKCDCRCKCEFDRKCPDCKVNCNRTEEENRCELNRLLIPLGENRPQVDVTVFRSETLDKKTVVGASAALFAQATLRTLLSVCHNLTCHVTSSPVMFQFVNSTPASPLYTLALNCGTVGTCDINICQCDSIPGVSFTVPSATIAPITITVPVGAATCTGTIEVGHST